MPNIVGVQFKEGGKVYYFASQNIQFEKGDGVIVETSRGVEYGTVFLANTDMDDDKVVGTLKPVVRKATDKDKSQHLSLVANKQRAMKDAQRCIEKHKLDMKLVDAEFAFDGSKAVFYFTADERVDFRELVKDLASMLHTRIDLRQIGIRDECKLKGGLGPCGRPCCCNSYMADFERVSIKMAKNQGLSINPTKISGLCGRLMCCLKFENDYYAETIKLMPRVGSEITTADGKAVVESTDILRQTVNARLTNSNGDVEIKKYHLKELSAITATAEEGGGNSYMDELDKLQD